MGLKIQWPQDRGAERHPWRKSYGSERVLCSFIAEFQNEWRFRNHFMPNFYEYLDRAVEWPFLSKLSNYSTN